MKLVFRLLIVAIGLLAVSYFVPGITIENFYTAILAGAVLGLINLFVRPILHLLTLPITILTLGLSVFIINAGLFLLAASFVPGFTVDGFLSAIIGSVIIGLINLMANIFIS